MRKTGQPTFFLTNASSFQIENDKVEGYNVTQSFNRQESWTKALQYTLYNLKWVLYWLIGNTTFNLLHHHRRFLWGLYRHHLGMLTVMAGVAYLVGHNLSGVSLIFGMGSNVNIQCPFMIGKI